MAFQKQMEAVEPRPFIGSPTSNNTCYLYPSLLYSILHHRASYYGSLKAVETLSIWKADVNAPDQSLDLRTPLHKAASQGHAEIVSALLMAGASVATLDGKGLTALEAALQEERNRQMDKDKFKRTIALLRSKSNDLLEMDTPQVPPN
eukprot:410272_1